MLSKAQNKYIRSLSQQKYRKEHNVFIAEGDKIAAEWLESSNKLQMIVCLQEWAAEHEVLITRHPEAELIVVDPNVLESVSTLQTPNKVLLVVHMPVFDMPVLNAEWGIALDGIQDPGNLGTIMRIADWYGINHIFCSPECVDMYNPKVVQSSMGAHLRVKVHYTDLLGYLSQINMPVLAAALEGENVYSLPKYPAAVLVIGNESKGISGRIMNIATTKVTIPRTGGAESLNAAVSTGILCALLKGS